MAAALPQLRCDLTSSASSVLGIALGNGWFRGRLGWSGGRALYGKELAALAQLDIEFSDGNVQTVVTDKNWTAGPSAVLSNDLYDGQTIDARRQSDAGYSQASPTWVGPAYTGPNSTSAPDSVRQSARQPAGRAFSDQDLDLPSGQDPGRFRAEPRGMGEGQCAGPGRYNDHTAARRST